MVTPSSAFAQTAFPDNNTHVVNNLAPSGAQRLVKTLRLLARDEALKAKLEADPVWFPIVGRAAQRYIGGTHLESCLGTIERLNAQGFSATADYMGESTRSEALAHIETEHFLDLIQAINAKQLNCTISLDLSHIGLAVDQALGVANAARIAQAAREIGREVMISMEGSERTDATLSAHRALCQQFDHVGITIQARMKRTTQDLSALLQLPGRIRLVKGAYEESEADAHLRDSQALDAAYRDIAARLIDSGHACSIGTHDMKQVRWALEHMQGGKPAHVEFETLLGLGPEACQTTLQLGYPTRQYVVYGKEWFLYVCHRIAENPERIFDAFSDAVGVA
jgi:proline dehydrogenase